MLQARDHFIHHIEILMKMKFRWLDKYVLPELSAEVRLYARLGVHDRLDRTFSGNTRIDNLCVSKGTILE